MADVERKVAPDISLGRRDPIFVSKAEFEKRLHRRATEKPLYSAIQMLKQLVSRELPHMSDESPFWEPRYYDFNVFTQKKWTEKLRYLHRNPVTRGLVANPEDWPWSSYRHWLTGDEGIVEIESHWTFSRRERTGIETSLTEHTLEETPSHPSLSPKEGE